MERYSVYGVAVQSEFSLPELSVLESAAESPDVVIGHGDVEPVALTDDEPRERRVDANPEVCRISYEDVGTFRIENGSRILFDPVSQETTSTKTFRRILIGQILGVLLHQRGLLVLHASAVEIDGGAAVFLGPTGAGKSTTAAACYANGCRLLDDDVVAIRLLDERPMVSPGVQQLKLEPETAAILGIDTAPADDDDGGAGKEYHQASSEGTREPKPLERCYLLSDGPEPAIEPASSHEQFMDLVSNTYTAGLLEDTGATKSHFRQCSRVAETTSVRELCRPDDLEALPTVVDQIIADMRHG